VYWCIEYKLTANKWIECKLALIVYGQRPRARWRKRRAGSSPLSPISGIDCSPHPTRVTHHTLKDRLAVHLAILATIQVSPRESVKVHTPAHSGSQGFSGFRVCPVSRYVVSPTQRVTHQPEQPVVSQQGDNNQSKSTHGRLPGILWSQGLSGLQACRVSLRERERESHPTRYTPT
jgi:hypothetical protein